MQHGNAGFLELAALREQPFRTNLFHLFIAFAFHDGIARYEHQYNRRGHHHMVCTSCGSSVEFFSKEVDRLEHEIGRKFNFQTTRHTFQIYGLCEDCRRKEARIR